MKNIIMSSKETERIPVMEKLVKKQLKQKEAGKMLGITVRHVRRVLVRYKKDGLRGLVHKSRGKESNRAIDAKEKERAIELITEKYGDFGPAFALEKLRDHGIQFGVDTLRKEMITEGLWKPKKKRSVNHPYRPRRTNVGEMVQLDGSPHKWFEDRDDPCTLIAFIDDATSRIMDGIFVDEESTFDLFFATEHYLKTYGKPVSLYVDKHSIYKVNRQATVEEELKDSQEQSQYTRAMDELGIEMIFANSPQAKGRAERLFQTLQDRLVKEMRLLEISNKDEGTKYFREVYLPKHNSKFAVEPQEKIDVHRQLSPSDNLPLILTKQSTRRVSKDLVVRYKNLHCQLQPKNGSLTLRKSKVLVAEHRDGKITVRYKGQQVPYRIVSTDERKIPQVVTSKSFTERQTRLSRQEHIPAPNHPWRHFRI